MKATAIIIVCIVGGMIVGRLFGLVGVAVLAVALYFRPWIWDRLKGDRT